jgi:hypothetical protein
MSSQQNAQSLNQEGRILLTLSAYNSSQFRSLRRATKAYSIPRSTLTRRYNGIKHPLETRNAQHKLPANKEQTIIQYILNLDSRSSSLLLQYYRMSFCHPVKLVDDIFILHLLPYLL